MATTNAYASAAGRRFLLLSSRSLSQNALLSYSHSLLARPLISRLHPLPPSDFSPLYTRFLSSSASSKSSSPHSPKPASFPSSPSPSPSPSSAPLPSDSPTRPRPVNETESGKKWFFYGPGKDGSRDFDMPPESQPPPWDPTAPLPEDKSTGVPRLLNLLQKGFVIVALGFVVMYCVEFSVRFFQFRAQRKQFEADNPELIAKYVAEKKSKHEREAVEKEEKTVLAQQAKMENERHK